MNVNERFFDVVILGSGPAGLQAAVYAARSKVKVAVLGRVIKSHLYRAHVENYFSLDSVSEGDEMLESGRRQAEKFGALFPEQDAVDLDKGENGGFLVRLESGEVFSTAAVVLATGISRNRLNVPGEKELLGKGVSYCVDCDAYFFRDETVVVVGDESSAAYGALNLLLIAGETHLVYQALNVDEKLTLQVERSDIIAHPGRKVKAILGENAVKGVLLDNDEEIAANGVFIEFGAKGALELAAKVDVRTDSETLKYIEVNKKQETNIPGVYAAGDICGPPWQVAKAVGEGCVAGWEAAAYAKKMRIENH